MATIEYLKQVLTDVVSTAQYQRPLSDEQYKAGCEILLQGPGWTSHQNFIIPQLCQLLGTLLSTRDHVSVLEIGPGPKSVLSYLPGHLREQINRYVAFETVFHQEMVDWLESRSAPDARLPFCLKDRPRVLGKFDVDNFADKLGDDEKFDVILFCHSMYGVKPQRRVIERVLNLLPTRSEGEMVVVFHNEGVLDFGDLVCHRTASFPDGVVSVVDSDEVLDQLSSFVTGVDTSDEVLKGEWRKKCRELARREKGSSNLFFSSPDIMLAFTRHATALPELTAVVPVLTGTRVVKNHEAQLCHPASIVKPTEIRHVQECVRWALKHEVGLTVLGGGHSGHCLRPNVVSVDMEAFDKVHIIPEVSKANEEVCGLKPGPLVVAEAGCKTGDIIKKTLAAGLTIPLGSRPSVGAGSWLQGGLGHLTRLYGLACDAIVGAVLVSVDSGEVFYVGDVPREHRPANATRPENEADLLWAIKGAGTNFGIVMSTTFRAWPTRTHRIYNWVLPVSKLRELDKLLARLRIRFCSVDAYIYGDASSNIRLGVTAFESYASDGKSPSQTFFRCMSGLFWPQNRQSVVVDSTGLFESDMYMSELHGGQGSGKFSAFKRCLFFKFGNKEDVNKVLLAAHANRPSIFSYFQLVHGGGAVGNVAADATAFGCRDWDYACVVSGVWKREFDGSSHARAVVQWVYQTVTDLLPLSSGAYAVDLGPDPRDAALAAKAFGPNLPRLARLKRDLDSKNVLAYACPILTPSMGPKLIILVSGESCAGKDYCASIWASMFATHGGEKLTARVDCISSVTKREYAAVRGADLNRLLDDRAYKEEHRQALTAFFQEQLQTNPRIAQDHFSRVVNGAFDVDVLLITGMRDDAPITTFARLVPNSRLLDVRVDASEEVRRARRMCPADSGDTNNNHQANGINGTSHSTASDYTPSHVFDNTESGNDAIEAFGKRYLLPYVHEDLDRLSGMVRSITGYPRRDITFRHVLGIAHQRGGLELCTSLMQSQFTGNWADIDAVVCCEAGGFIFAAPLAARVNVPLALIREAGKLPPPTYSIPTYASHISASSHAKAKESRLEMSVDAIPRGGSVVIVDDVFATGTTLCAMLRLLGQFGVGPDRVKVLVVAEFPVHDGRGLLRKEGFGAVQMQSLLLFDGA